MRLLGFMDRWKAVEIVRPQYVDPDEDYIPGTEPTVIAQPLNAEVPEEIKLDESPDLQARRAVVGVLWALTFWLTYFLLFHNKFMLAITAAINALLLVRVLLGLIIGPDEEKVPVQGVSADTPPIRLDDRRGVEPDGLIAKYLTEGERVIWQGNRHPLSQWMWFSLTAGVTLLFIVVGSTTGHWKPLSIGWLIAMSIVAFKLWDWTCDRWYITNQRLMQAHGVFRRQVNEMPLGKLTDLRLIIPMSSRLLHFFGLIKEQYGTFVAESAGQDQALSKVTYMSDVVRQHRRINTFSKA